MKKPESQVKSKSRNPTGKGGFKKGQSGNPGGMKKGTTSFKAMLTRMGLDPSIEDPKLTKDEAITKKIYEIAEGGDKWAIQFVVERREGKPSQSIEQINVDVDAGNWDKDNETSEEYINRVLSSNK